MQASYVRLKKKGWGKGEGENGKTRKKAKILSVDSGNLNFFSPTSLFTGGTNLLSAKFQRILPLARCVLSLLFPSFSTRAPARSPFSALNFVLILGSRGRCSSDAIRVYRVGQTRQDTSSGLFGRSIRPASMYV